MASDPCGFRKNRKRICLRVACLSVVLASLVHGRSGFRIASEPGRDRASGPGIGVGLIPGDGPQARSGSIVVGSDSAAGGAVGRERPGVAPPGRNVTGAVIFAGTLPPGEDPTDLETRHGMETRPRPAATRPRPPLPATPSTGSHRPAAPTAGRSFTSRGGLHWEVDPGQLRPLVPAPAVVGSLDHFLRERYLTVLRFRTPPFPWPGSSSRLSHPDRRGSPSRRNPARRSRIEGRGPSPGAFRGGRRSGNFPPRYGCQITLSKPSMSLRNTPRHVFQNNTLMKP
jgi:hypothetical protein